MRIEQISPLMLTLNGNAIESIDLLITNGLKVNSIISHFPNMFGQEDDWEHIFKYPIDFINYFNEIFLKLDQIIDSGYLIFVGGNPYSNEICEKASKIFTRINNNFFIKEKEIAESICIGNPVYIFGKNLQKYHYNDSFIKNEYQKLEKSSSYKYEVNVYDFLVQLGSNENDLVLDLFMDNGAIGVCCNKLNRKYIGIEENTIPFEIAKNNLKNCFRKE